MRLERVVQVEPYQPITFTSSEHATPRECAADLVAQMQPLLQYYPVLANTIKALKGAFGV